LLEAIAWAIYGNPAARGDKDPSATCAPRRARRARGARLRAGQPRLPRGTRLNNAELYQDGVVVANSLKEVTGRLQRVLGMTHDEFFNTLLHGSERAGGAGGRDAPRARRVSSRACCGTSS